MIDQPAMMPPNHAELGLADRLKLATEPLHRQAERSGIIQDMLRGRAGRPAYGLLLRNLLPVYEAIERGLEQRQDSALIGPFAQPALYRAAALRSDLAHLVGGGFGETLPVLPSARRYSDRITDASEGDGALLIAHAYVRYLGDLNGGQFLKRALGRHLDLGPDNLTFYDFPNLGDPQAFAVRYRAAMDEAAGSIGSLQSVLDEAATAFRLNIDLSEDVRRVASSPVAEPA